MVQSYERCRVRQTLRRVREQFYPKPAQENKITRCGHFPRLLQKIKKLKMLRNYIWYAKQNTSLELKLNIKLVKD